MARLHPALRSWWPEAKRAYTAGTRIVSPATRLVSRTVGRDLPQGFVASAEQAVRPAHGGGRMTEVRALEKVRRALPDGDPPRHWRFAVNVAATIPRVAVMELPGGRVIGPHGAVVTRTGHLVEEVSPYFGTLRGSEHPLFLRPFLPAPADVDGRVAVLAARGDGNYYHFLFDVLPRLDALDRAGDIGRAEKFYVPTGLRFQEQSLEAFGIGPDRVIDARTIPHLRADTLVVPGLPDIALQTPSWVVPLLRERILGSRTPARCDRRIWITRTGGLNTRRVVNQDEVVGALEDRGFESVDPAGLTVTEQADLFAGAEVIVAPHGAALANLAFASPGCRVIELFPPDYVNVCYWVLAERVEGLSYRYLVGRGTPSRRRERGMAGVASDIRIDVPSLLRLVD